MEFRKILIPLDGSSLAELALDKVGQLAAKEHTTITLLRAAEAHVMPPLDPVEAQIAVVREADDYVNRIAARLRERGFKKVETSIWYGAPAAAIVEAAEVQKPDLIMMSTHGRSGLGRLILGSVAESVVRGTTAPILLLRATTAPVERPQGQANLPARTTEARR
jgi:nucleotide-binding universal stress UspA family protein